MYSCYEIPHYAYPTIEELTAAVERYPFKGGLCKKLTLGEPKILAKPYTERLTRDRAVALRDARWEEFSFMKSWKVSIGSFPNGNDNTITIYAT
jgi:hypothetical protein